MCIYIWFDTIHILIILNSNHILFKMHIPNVTHNHITFQNIIYNNNILFYMYTLFKIRFPNFPNIFFSSKNSDKKTLFYSYGKYVRNCPQKKMRGIKK